MTDLTNTVAADFSPDGCLTTDSMQLSDWLFAFDPLWNSGCP